MGDWTKVCDFSRAQGSVDFAVLKARGIDGVILRATHGLTVDSQLSTYAPAAQAAFGLDAIGYYEFCNPKRGTPQDCARALVAAVQAVHPLERTFLMLDIESYVKETPDVGTFWSASRYTEWLYAHIAALRMLTAAPIIGYTNRSYWSQGVGDRHLAASLEWICARYPCYSLDAYASHPLPTDPDKWDEWAFGLATGPQEPLGAAGWQGWQFSGGYNRQGAFYGASSSDLDLNIIRPEAWMRWTRTAPPAVTEQGDTQMFRTLQMSGGPLVVLITPDAVRRASGEEARSIPAPAISRQGLLDVFSEGARSVGDSPFGGRFGDGYADADLDAAWNSHHACPSSTMDTSALDAKLDSLRGQMEALYTKLGRLDFLLPGDGH